jgi:nucleoside-diphosphate-sugar epimerase
MNIVVTGSTGFIGSNLIEELLRSFREDEITCLTRDNGNTRPHERLKTHTVDYLNKNSLESCRVLREADIVYHLAGVTKSSSKRGFWEGNVIPTRNLLEVIGEHNTSIQRFVLISSQTASGCSRSGDHYRTEEEEENPMEVYGQSKLEAEKLVKGYLRRIPFTIISPSSVYGPADPDFLAIFRMTKYGLNFYAGNRNQVISIIYIKDLVRAIVDASFSENTVNRKYFVCNDDPLSWSEIHDTIFRTAGKRKLDVTLPMFMVKTVSSLGSLYSLIAGKSILVNANKARLASPSYWLVSNMKAKRDFGFQSRFSFVQGIQETYEWYKTHGWL